MMGRSLLPIYSFFNIYSVAFSRLIFLFMYFLLITNFICHLKEMIIILLLFLSLILNFILNFILSLILLAASIHINCVHNSNNMNKTIKIYILYIDILLLFKCFIRPLYAFILLFYNLINDIILVIYKLSIYKRTVEVNHKLSTDRYIYQLYLQIDVISNCTYK